MHPNAAVPDSSLHDSRSVPCLLPADPNFHKSFHGKLYCIGNQVIKDLHKPYQIPRKLPWQLLVYVNAQLQPLLLRIILRIGQYILQK